MAKKRFSGMFLMMVLALAAGICPQHLPAQGTLAGNLPPAQFAFRVYGPEQGLGNLAVWAVTQDLQGFIWVATEFGVYRYDGHRFVGYTVSHGLPSTYVDHLLVTRAGKLWAGTISGLACLEGDRFRAARDENGLITSAVTDLALGPEDRVWVGLSRGPFRLEGDGCFRLVPGWPGGAVTALWRNPESGALWLASRNQTVTKIYRWEQGVFNEVPGDTRLAASTIDAFAMDGQKRVWARSLQDLWSLPAGGEKFERLLPAIPPVTQIGALATDQQGRLLVSTSRGVWWQQPGGWLTIGTAEGLPNSTIKGMFMDREGSLWLASIGLFRLQGRGMWRAYTTAQGFPSELVWTVFRDRDGRLIVGTDRGPVLSSSGGFSPVAGMEGHQVRTIVQAPDGTFFMAGAPEIVHWDPRSGRMDFYGPEAGVITEGRIFRLVLDKKNRLWAGTQAGGLLCGTLRGDHWRFTRVRLPGESREEWIRDLRLDSDGRVWATGTFGLAVLDGETWRRIGVADGLKDAQISYACQRRDGTMVAVYFNALGLSQFRYRQGRVESLEHLDAQRSFSPGKIYLVGEDAAGNLWVGTGMGIDVIQAGGHIEHFSREDGLIGEDTSAQAFLADPDGTVWIGTSAGLARFDAGAHPVETKPPSPVILQTRFGDQPENLAIGRDMKIPYQRRTLEIEFSTLSFIREGAIRHQTRLIGLDSKWREIEGRSQLFPGLPPDQYTFEVRSRIGQSDWGPATGFSFTILPAWWQAWWFRGLILLSVILAGALIIQWRTRTLRSRNIHLEELVQARTAALEEAMENLRNLSLTDPLTGLRNRRFLSLSIPKDVAIALRNYNNLARGQLARMPLNVDLLFLMVDLDHFKGVNDHYGHAAGDEVLRQTKDILASCVRDSDTVVRWGGEEFLVVGRNACRSDSWTVAERIRSTVEQHEFALGNGQRIRLTCSAGGAFFPFLPKQPDALDWEKVVAIADYCLYAAKRSGRNAWVGVLAIDGTRPDDIGTDFGFWLPRLIAEKQLTLHTSLADPGAVDWEAKE